MPKFGVSIYSVCRKYRDNEWTPMEANKWLAEQGAEVIEIVPFHIDFINEPEIIDQMKEAAKEAGETAPEAPVEEVQEEVVIDIEPKAEISYGDFAKLQFQVGEIIACEEVKKSKKLLCSKVKVGSQVRTIVSGIKAHYTPDQMVGKKVMVLVNLAPRAIAGIMSGGMLLCAEGVDGELALMTPEKNVPAGAEIG